MVARSRDLVEGGEALAPEGFDEAVPRAVELGHHHAAGRHHLRPGLHPHLDGVEGLLHELADDAGYLHAEE